MDEARLLAELGAALASPEGAGSVARFARREELVQLAAAFAQHRKQEAAAAAAAVAANGAAAAAATAAAAAVAAAVGPESAAAPPPPIAAWGDAPGTPRDDAVAADAPPHDKSEEWKPPAWDPGTAFNAFQGSPQGPRRGAAAKARGRGTRRSSGRRSGPVAGEEAPAPPAEPAASDGAGAAQFAFNFQGLRIGEEPGDAAAPGDADDIDIADMDTEGTPGADARTKPPRAHGQSPVRASVPPPGKPPASGGSDSDAFVPAAVPSPGLTAATVPQFNVEFNMGAPATRSSRKPRRKARQRDAPSQDSSPAGVDAPPVVSTDARNQPAVSTLPEDSSDRAKIAEVTGMFSRFVFFLSLFSIFHLRSAGTGLTRCAVRAGGSITSGRK